ncbi:Pre-mRNA-splicing factor cwf19 [Sporothrix eucalyptigena]|uniref:Pre-mRNA-splicing factor cwf19 n=1 Tax=Sporothrix eucalyptigena TaxID=1812306 RepID=A0ABP0D092_9PEZI
MKAKLRKAPDLAKLQVEYEQAASAFALGSGNGAAERAVVLDASHSRMLAGTRAEARSIDTKRGKERGLVEANDDMTIEDMVREERRTRGAAGGEGMRLAERISKDTKFDDDLEYLDENAENLAKHTHKSESTLKNMAVHEYTKMNKILESCPLCHHEDRNPPQDLPVAPIVSLATRSFLTLSTDPELTGAEGGAVIVPIDHHTNLLECNDDEWEEIRNFMKSLTRLYHDQGRDVIFYENAAAPHRRMHAALVAVPIPYELGDTAPAFFREAMLSVDEEWSQHKKIIDTGKRAREGLGNKDVQRAQRHPKGGGKEYITPPLLVMNGFNLAADASAKVPKHLESLITTVFQSLFPPINPQAAPLKSMRRVLLLNRENPDGDEDSFVLNFRHYAITTKTTGISKALKRLNAAEKLVHSKNAKKGGLPNLGKLQDIADYMVGGDGGDGYVTDGATSGSEAETDAEVEVVDTAAGRIQARKIRWGREASQDADGDADSRADDTGTSVEKRAVKLVELGPRMKLRLVKVEEGMCQGQVMWHEHVHKSKQEIRELKERWEQRKRDKEARKQQQKENVERKKKEKTESGKAHDKGIDAGDDEDEDAMDMDDFDSEDYDGFDSEGLAGDAEMEANERMDDAGEWEDEEEEIVRS